MIERSHGADRQESSKPEIRFRLVTHGQNPQNIEQLLPDLLWSDMIFCEYVNLTGFLREFKQNQFNLVLANLEELSETDRALQTLYREDLETSPQFIDVLVCRLAGQGKKIQFVDIDDGHPLIAKEHEWMALKSDAQTHIIFGNFAEAMRLYKAYLVSAGEFDVARDHLVAQQVTEATIAHAIQKGVVIQGAVHFTTSQEVSHLFPDWTISSAYNFGYRYFIGDKLNLMVRQHPDRIIPEVEYKRGLLCQCVGEPTLGRLRGDERSLQEINTTFARISPSHIEELWNYMVSFYQMRQEIPKDKRFFEMSRRIVLYANDMAKAKADHRDFWGRKAA